MPTLGGELGEEFVDAIVLAEILAASLDAGELPGLPGSFPEALLLGGGDPPVPASSAWAIPEPLARAAPTPSVITPAPSHMIQS